MLFSSNFDDTSNQTMENLDCTIMNPSAGESFNNFHGRLNLSSELNISYLLDTRSELCSGESANFTLQNATEDFWWSVFDSKNLRHSIGWTITLIISYVAIFIIGIIGNSMVILVISLRPNMRSVTNMFIMNLAVADFFVIVGCVPATLLSNVLSPWILGSFMCKGVAYVQGVSVCASAYSLTAISIERCKAIYQPLKKGFSETQASVIICIIWIVSLLLILPWIFVFNVTKSEKDDHYYCIETWENKIYDQLYFSFANLICCYLLPLAVISISNILILTRVSKRKVPPSLALTEPIEMIHKKTRHGVKRMLSIVTSVFLISWLPLYVLVILVKFPEEGGNSEYLTNTISIIVPFAQWLGMSNSCVNPVLYALLNSKFKESFQSLLPSWMPFSKGEKTPSNGLTVHVSVTRSPASPSCHTMPLLPIRKNVGSRQVDMVKTSVQRNQRSQRISLQENGKAALENKCSVLGERY